MTESFDMQVENKDSARCSPLLKVIVVIFVVFVIIVGLLSGLLSARQANRDAVTVCDQEKEKLRGELMKDYSTTTVAPTLTTTQAPECSKEIWCSVRLPKAIIPYHYNLELTSHVEELKYNGTQEILLNISQPIDVILVHIKDILIDSVSVKNLGSGVEMDVERSFAFPENEYYVTKLKENMATGNYLYTLKFRSNVSSTLTGFYKSNYKHNGVEKTLLTTKFQPTDARRAFPCLDEPDLKASFNITMHHRKEYHTRSNMPGTVTDSPILGWSTTKFGKTVKMSPYLICFIVSQFKSEYEGVTGNRNTTISVWSQPDLVNSTEYAYNTSVKMLAYFEDFLGVDYPMPKLDNFAIPDYGSGATEHWGIITYRESRLLYTPGVSSKSNQMSSAGIIAHEIAHLWFGNLVTCKWWDDLWVQEGMANYLENYALNYTHPEWNSIDNFLTSDWKRGMTLDSYASSHPISQRVDHPKQIKEIFDAITYSKGASLFQMLDYYLGTDEFRKSLKKYLVENQFEGATVNDLWKAFDTVTGENITGIMNTWTHQMGFPVITIRKTNNGFSLEQKHFLIDPRVKVTVKSPYNYQWIIPFTYALSDDLSLRKTEVFDGKTASIVSSAQWIIGNYHHRGFYRVNYDENGWKKIQEQLNNNRTDIAAIDRAGLIDDAFTLARAGEIPYTTALDMLSFIDEDLDSMVWSMAISNINFLENVLSSQNAYSMLRSYIAKKVDKRIYTTDNVIVAKYLQIAAKNGLETAIQIIQHTFNEWMINGTEISVNLQSTVYYYGVEYGGDKEWDFVFKKYKESTNPSIRSKLQSALSASQKPWILNKWLRYSINSSVVKTQDTVYVIGAVASRNPIGKYLAYNFASANWNDIMAIAQENNFHVASLTTSLTSQFTTEYDLQMAEELWKKYPEAGTGKKAREQGLEKIRGNIYWLQQYYGTLETWLKKNI